MGKFMDQDLIERYGSGGPLVREAIDGLSHAELNADPVPGTWSIQEIVLHLMDSDLIGADRMKRVAAEEHPTLIGYNETLFAKSLYAPEIDAALAAEIFSLNRRMTAAMLGRLPDSALARTGYHNEHGDMTLEQFLNNYIEHLDHHLKFIREKRRLLGKA